MLRFVKHIVWLLGVMIGCQSAFGFALIGPIPASATAPDGFEQPVIGYALPSDLSTPKDIKEEFRRNTPVMYYSFDTAFLDYFGPTGAAEVDKAMAMFNSVGDTSSLDIDDYPEDSRRVNFRAEADGLFDLKSFIMWEVTEQLGFYQPTRWVWALHSRVPGIACPTTATYSVFQRNFSDTPVGLDTYPTTTYVNGVLYSYFIDEICTGPNPLADAVEFPVDPLSSPFSAVADAISRDYEGLQNGGFYTSLTRDDVAAMKYLYNTNNLNNEASGSRTTEFLTNNAPAVIQTQDLSSLASAARTNTAAQLIALFPGLIITSTSNFFGLQITTNVTETLVNFPTDPAGLLPSHPIFSTNYSTNFANFFEHTFANVVTNTFATRGIIGQITLSLASAPFAPAGTVVTTNGLLTLKPIPVTGVFGDFFILPTNLCSAQILSNLLTTVTATTNLPTQTQLTTNLITFTPGSITFATNHLVVYLPVSCPVDSIAIRGGVDRVQFVRRDFDSIVSQVWDPITNDYTVTELDVTNRVLVRRHFQRRVPRPDLLFSAVDLANNVSFTYSNTVDNATETFTFTLTGGNNGTFNSVRTLQFDDRGRATQLAGPGTIVGGDGLGTIITLNKIAPAFQNSVGLFLVPNELSQVNFTAFGSFDGTTNAPTVYPNGTSLEELEDIIIGPSSNTPSLPDANIGAPYSAQLSAIGGTAPYTWALAPGSPGLPAGLNLSSNGQITGIPTGPAAIYDFTVRLTDFAGVFRDVQHTITVF